LNETVLVFVYNRLTLQGIMQSMHGRNGKNRSFLFMQPAATYA